MSDKTVKIYVTGYYDSMGEFIEDKAFFKRGRAEAAGGSWMDIRVYYMDKEELDLFISCEYNAG